MTPPADPTNRGRTAGRMRLAVLAGVLALLLSSCFTSQQNTVARFVNKSRSNHDVRQVEQNLQLTNKAQSWAEYLAREGKLQHSKLSKGISYKWKALAENVGYGNTIKQVHQAYMKSPGHRGNILDGRFNYIGTGHAKRQGKVFTVHVYMKY